MIALALGAAACTAPRVPDESGDDIPAGGAVVVGVLGEAPTLDPYSKRATDLTRALVRPLYPSLFRFSPGGDAEPYLAETWERVGDELELRLVEARWSDGSPITADDVVASAARARPPSGFAAFDQVTATGDTSVTFSDIPEDWRLQLARMALVLPGGRARARPAVSGGPLRLRRATPGLEVVYERNPQHAGAVPTLDRVSVRFVQSHEIMLELLARDELDVALVPSSVNLDDRLEAMDLEFQDVLGWETVRLSFNNARLSETERRAIGSMVNRRLLTSGFVRDDGRLAGTIFPAPGPGGARGPWSSLRAAGGAPDFSLAASAGDELLALMQRAIFESMKSAGVSVDVVAADPALLYGQWGSRGPADSFLRRVAGAPGAAGERRAFAAFTALPIAQVETVMAWRPGIRGVAVNPTMEGPLWNVEDWEITAEGS